MVEWKQTGAIFFENKLLQQPDVVFDSESNGCNFSSIAPPGCEKEYFQFFYKMTSLKGVDVFWIFFSLKWKFKENKWR